MAADGSVDFGSSSAQESSSPIIKKSCPQCNGTMVSAETEKNIQTFCKLQTFSSDVIRKNFSIFQVEVKFGSIEHKVTLAWKMLKFV